MAENFLTSKKLIKEIIKNSPQYVSKLYIANNASGSDIKEIIEIAKNKKVSFLSVPKQKILDIFNQGYSGVLLITSPVKYLTIDEFINKTKKKEKNLVVLLDEIKDPQNFGAIIRTSSAFDVDGIFIQQWNQVPITQSVIEVSKGGIYNLDIVKVKNIHHAIVELKKINFWIYATVPKESSFSQTNLTEISEISKLNNIGIVFGNEEKGIRKNILNECDGIITIEHSSKMQSLNVSVSCGIILYEIYRTFKNKVEKF
ncbi:MAG: 23S rRNA (guanosine(2251)-2'-O)-methyltransferase RlmB [Endomicrobiia bacterium]